MANEEYHALWRSSAHEAVPYTDDYPEALLVLPELSDGSIGQGNATRITFQIEMNGTKSKLTVTDNGGGIRNERRLLSWAASKATSNIHRNGHGTKKTLTKWEPDYTKAIWTIRWRVVGKNLQTTKGPFVGYNPDNVLDDEGADQTSLMPSGCEISIHFNEGLVLGPLANKPDDLYIALKELIQTRYSEDTLLKTDFIIDITSPSNKKLVPRSSHKEKWHSFKTCVEMSVRDGDTTKLHESKHNILGGHYTIEIFYINVDGKKSFKLKTEFPKYGLKSMKSSRAHISLDNRMIEAMPIYQMLGLEANHNDYNGYKVFVNFVPNTKDDFVKLPVPCTTKVSLYENDPVYKAFLINFAAVFVPVEKQKFKEVDKAKTTAKAHVTPVAPASAAPVVPLAPIAPVPAAPVVPVPVAPVAPVVPVAPVAPVRPAAPAPVAPRPPAPPPTMIPVGPSERHQSKSIKDILLALHDLSQGLQDVPFSDKIMEASSTGQRGLVETYKAIQVILEYTKTLKN